MPGRIARLYLSLAPAGLKVTDLVTVAVEVSMTCGYSAGWATRLRVTSGRTWEVVGRAPQMAVGSEKVGFCVNAKCPIRPHSGCDRCSWS